MQGMARRRFSQTWVRAAVLLAAPFLLTTSLADAQTKGKKKKDPCDPTYVPAKDEPPPTCPGVTEVQLQPAQGPASLAPTPPPVPKKKPAATKKADADKPATVNVPGFRMTRTGETKIFVQIHGKPEVRQYATRAGVTYVLSDCRVPVYNNRHPLMTQYFNTPVSDARLRQHRKDVHLQIDLRAPSSPTARLIELVKDEVALLEVTFPAGNYYAQIPSGPMRGIPGRGKRRNESYSGGTPPPGSRGNRGSAPPATGGRSSVLGPPAP